MDTGMTAPSQEDFLPRKYSEENLDRFIPNRAAMDFDYAQFALTERRNETTKLSSSPSKVAYRKQLAEALNLNRTRILAFKKKPQAPVRRCYDLDSKSCLVRQPVKPPCRYIPRTCERELDLPDIVDDLNLNLLDWSSSNVLAIALDRSVYLRNASSGSASASVLVTVDEHKGPVTSLNWSKDGCYLAVGLNNSQVQLWDCAANREVRRLKGRRHEGRVGSLAWNSHILTTGRMDGKIINNDVRISSHVVNSYTGHSSEVCALKWSESGNYLASGGNDNVVHIWSKTRQLHRLQGHTSAVKGLAWSPFQSSLLATGGDETIKFWNMYTGACLNSVDTGSQVSSLLWSNKESELLSSHGNTSNHLTLWKYPSMVKLAELTGHKSPVLYMAPSPDGCSVASASGDETLKIWNVFGDPKMPKKAAPTSVSQPFSHVTRIR